MVQWLRFHAPNAGGPGLISDQGTRSHMPQLRVCVCVCVCACVCVCVCVFSYSVVSDSLRLYRLVIRQTPLSLGFSWQEY